MILEKKVVFLCKNLKSNRIIISESGLTLVELLMVILLIALISAIGIGRIDGVSLWKQKSDIRLFLNTLELLQTESITSGESYRLIIDLTQSDKNSFFVRREIPQQATRARKVDHLKNLRTRGEQDRRAQKDLELGQTLDEEFEAEDLIQGGTLEELFYRSQYSDPQGDVKLGRPLRFPSMAERQSLTNGISFVSVFNDGEELEDGLPFVQFNPQGRNRFAVIKIKANDDFYSVLLRPGKASAKLIVGEHDHKLLLQEEEKRLSENSKFKK